MIALLAVFAHARPAPAEAPVVWPPPPEPARVRAELPIVTSDWARRPPHTHGFAQVLRSLVGARAAVGFKKPYGVTTDSRGRVFVSDTGWGKVLVFDRAGRAFSWVGDAGQGALQKPAGLTTDARDHLYVADLAVGAVLEYDERGAFVRTWGSGRMTRPVAVAWNPVTDALWITDSKEHQIEIVSLATGETRSLGARGSADGAFNFPTNLAAGPDGRMYVVDTFNFRVQVFGPDGTFERKWGANCDTYGCFAKPKGVGVAPDGRVFVADAAFNNVQVFDPDGVLLLAFGGVGNGVGHLYLPAGLHVDDSDHVYVVSQYNWRVNLYDYLGDGAPDRRTR